MPCTKAVCTHRPTVRHEMCVPLSRQINLVTTLCIDPEHEISEIHTVVAFPQCFRPESNTIHLDFPGSSVIDPEPENQSRLHIEIQRIRIWYKTGLFGWDPYRDNSALSALMTLLWN